MRDISPPLAAGILMSSGRGEWAPYEGTRLPLHARAIVIANDRQSVGLVSLDLLGLADEAVGGMDDFKRRVAAHAGNILPPGRIVLASTHTHAGPESLALSDLYRSGPFRGWVDTLAQRIGEALRDAASSPRPCRLLTGSRSCEGFAENRRVKTATGLISARAVRPNDEVYGPEGPVDKTVRVAAFVDRSDRPVAVLVNATSHPVFESRLKQISPDYPGEMAKLLEQRHPGATILFLQGAAGNINPPDPTAGVDGARRVGRLLADAVQGAMSVLRPCEGDGLALDWRRIELPARALDGQPQEEPLRATIGAMRFGGAAMVFLPGEAFLELALAMRRRSPFTPTFVVGYAESYIGYLPTDRAFRNGGYEVGPGRWSRAASGSEQIVVQAASDLLQSLNMVSGTRPAAATS